MQHHPDFAIPITQPMEASAAGGAISGRVIALGWWVDPEAADREDHEPAGTLYLIVDERHPRPMWVAQDDLQTVQMIDT